MVTLFLCGDVMTGRGIDQILPHPVAPHLYEPYARSALQYVELAEQAHGRIARPVTWDYVWGDALAEIDRRRPDARIVNLETAVTTSEDAWPKGINYRMHPANVGCLTVARLDCCVLANNHVLDWGYEGLAETMAVLHAAGLRTAGAGASVDEAAAPAIVDCADGARVLVYGCAVESSGVSGDWAATATRPGVLLLAALGKAEVECIAERIADVRRDGDLVVLSIHWGANWGYDVARAERRFAHALIDRAGVDLVHGHSSHHVRGVEIHRGKPIVYGCGDLLNDYEGIGGYERYRPDLALMYFASFSDGALEDFTGVSVRVWRFSLRGIDSRDAEALAAILRRECGRLDTDAALSPDGTIRFAARVPG